GGIEDVADGKQAAGAVADDVAVDPVAQAAGALGVADQVVAAGGVHRAGDVGGRVVGGPEVASHDGVVQRQVSVAGGETTALPSRLVARDGGVAHQARAGAVAEAAANGGLVVREGGVAEDQHAVVIVDAAAGLCSAVPDGAVANSQGALVVDAATEC